LLNSILLEGVEVNDNVRIIDSVIGVGCYVGEGAVIKGTYSEAGCRVADGMKI